MSLPKTATSPSPFVDVDQAPAEIKQHVVDYLDRTARHHEIQRMRATAFEMFAPSENERLLDAGCGVGEVARQLGGRVGAHGSVTALDASGEVVTAATARHDGSPVTYAVGDILDLDFPDGHFDGVRSERVIQHLADPDAAIRELARVVRPGGRLSIVDTDWESVVHDGFDHLDEVMRVLTKEVIQHPALGRSVRSRMLKAGLRNVTTLPVTLRFTSPGDATTVLPLFESGSMLWSRLPEELRLRFTDSVNRAAARGDFLVAFTIWITVGRVAEVSAS
jgi:ubiquinone/menaquinone biosynthesis C-methylase UbiE